ncbi:MAG: DUF6498-containing protein [Cytophagaceae bacterium]|jgi:hypothetical protein|nr:DUF6498-containing protein [Cytophagaceae bacterium]
MAKKDLKKGKNNWWNVLLDPECWFLLLFNAFLYYEYKKNPSLETSIICTFYLQSIVIGVFHVFKLVYFGERSGSPLTTTSGALVAKGNWAMAGFFALHFGLFHFVYLIFLVVMVVMKKQYPDPSWLGISVAMIVVNALFSLLSDVRSQKSGTPVKVEFAAPYLRILPMHFTIILSFIVGFDQEIPWWTFGLGVFEFFLILKIIADVMSYIMVSGVLKRERKGAWTWFLGNK